MENVYSKEPYSKGGKGFFESREANEVYVGWGSPTIQRIAFFPKNIEVKVGESVNFVSKVGKVAEPHTVTFVMDRNSLPDGTNLAAYTKIYAIDAFTYRF